MAEPSRSKELLDLPLNPKPSVLESLCVVGGSREEVGTPRRAKKRRAADAAMVQTDRLPQSQLLGKVQDFLGKMAEANEKLRQTPREVCDIEVLTGNGKYIEMDLLLGVTDLRTDAAVSAAEAALNGFTSSVKPTAGSSSEDSDSDLDVDGKDETDGADRSVALDETPVQERKRNKQQQQKIVMLD